MSPTVDPLKMKLKDIIFTAIFSVLFFACILLVMMVLGSNPATFFFIHGIGAIPGGIIYMYMRARTPKRGAILLMGVLLALIAFGMGIAWPAAAGLFVGGILAEAISACGHYTGTRWNVAAYVVFICCFWGGHISYVVFGTESFINTMTSQGAGREYLDALILFVRGPMSAVCLGVTALCALFGGILGNILFNKHFAKLNA